MKCTGVVLVWRTYFPFSHFVCLFHPSFPSWLSFQFSLLLSSPLFFNDFSLPLFIFSFLFYFILSSIFLFRPLLLFPFYLAFLFSFSFSLPFPLSTVLQITFLRTVTIYYGNLSERQIHCFRSKARHEKVSWYRGQHSCFAIGRFRI